MNLVIFPQLPEGQLFIRACQVQMLQPRLLQLPLHLQRAQYNTVPGYYVAQRQAWFLPIVIAYFRELQLGNCISTACYPEVCECGNYIDENSEEYCRACRCLIWICDFQPFGILLG